MENAVDALKMAGAVFIFVLAVSIIIFSFSQVRQTADTIIDYRDRTTTYSYYEPISGGVRKVNMETIIPCIFRVYLENYRISFEGLSTPLYKMQGPNGMIDKYSLDLETNANSEYRNVVLANDAQKKEFLRGILYHDYINGQKVFEDKFNVSMTGCNSLYDQLKDKTNIQESLGVYYQDDNPDVPEINKTEKRIITYKITN